MTEDDEEKTGFHTEEGVYCFTHMPKELKKISSYTSEDDGEGLNRSKRTERGNILGKNSNKKQKFLGHLVTKEGVRADPEKVQYPIRKVRVRFEATEGSGWTNEAEEALQRIKRKLNKFQTLAVPKEGEILMLCLCHKDETISSVLLVEREGIQISVSYASRPLQGMEICYTPTEKMVHALIHTTRSLRAIFRKHKVKMVTDGPIEEILKLSGKEGRFSKMCDTPQIFVQ
ncbi:reverse transcriptase domain-containing protein [Tanacetum coccineum]